MAFEQVIGHARPVRLLGTMLRLGRLPHALLFTGPQGVGKTTLARALAQAVNCQNQGSAPCAGCVACEKIARGVHPDLHVLEPQGKAEVIKIEAVRELIAQTMYPPFEGRAKVFIVRQAQKMPEAAANALLKTLEEPPDKSLIILTAPQESDLLPTILSRCMRLNLAPLPLPLVERLLRERGVGEPEARLAAMLGGGCLGRALDLAPETIFARRDAQAGRLAALAQTPEAQLMAQAQALAQEDEELADFFGLASLWLRDLMLAACGASQDLTANQDLAAQVRSQARGVSPLAAAQALERLARAEEDINRMARKDLVLENLFFDLSAIFRGEKPLEQDSWN